MSSTIADALRATIPDPAPAEHPSAGIITPSVRSRLERHATRPADTAVEVPTVDGGQVLAGPGTGIPSPPPPPAPPAAAAPTEEQPMPVPPPVEFPTAPPVQDEPAPQPEPRPAAAAPEPEPEPTRQRPERVRREREPGPSIGERWDDLRWKWSDKPMRFRAPVYLAAAGAAVLVAAKWVVPWAMPEPSIVTIEIPTGDTAPPATAQAAAAPATVTQLEFDPLSFGGPVRSTARVLIGADTNIATGEYTWTRPARALDVAQQAVDELGRNGGDKCALRIYVPAPGALKVTSDPTAADSVLLFECPLPTTTTAAG